jgi:hypothetical protein
MLIVLVNISPKAQSANKALVDFDKLTEAKCADELMLSLLVSQPTRPWFCTYY